jgi:transcription-repair coupling factor (superfamily II helicase)
VLAKPYGVAKIDAGPKLMNIVFRPNPPIDAQRIIALVQKNRSVKLAGNDKLRIEREFAAVADRAQYVRDVLRATASGAAAGRALSPTHNA